MAYLGDLGDVQVCTTPMCDAGKASVDQMNSVFASLSAELQAQFQSAHDAIQQSFNANYSWYSDMIPFNTTCCTVQAIGAQADQLTAQMLTAAGQSGVGTGPATGNPPASLPGVASLALPLLVGGAIAAYVLLKKGIV